MKIAGLSKGDLNYLRPYFNGEKAGPERYRYVIWIDIMGARSKMLRSVRTASIPIMKLHVAALTAIGKNRKQPIELFPMIDGLYVISEHLDPLRFFISDIFRSMAAEFIAIELWERSVVRGGLAYGPVILGRESRGGADILGDISYADSILIGMPLIQAYTSESNSPPFGLYVHESARAFAPPDCHPVTHILWRWWQTDDKAKKVASVMLQELDKFYDYCRTHTAGTFYEPERIQAHQKLAHEYFAEFGDSNT